MDNLKSAWQSIVSSNQSQIFNTLAIGANIARNALTQLSPFISEVASKVEDSAGRFQTWVESSDTANKAFSTLRTDGMTIFDNLLQSAGKFGDGLVRIFTQFSPLFVFMAKGLNDLAEKFDIWSSKVSTSQGINNFINYVKTKLPIIGKIFGDTFIGIVSIFKAFGSNSSSFRLYFNIS